MDLDSALYMAMVDDDITKHCHVNSNEDGDRFVGIKADSDNAMVYFPIGYQLPETDAEIRTDIKHLIQILSEFTTKEDRLLAINKFAAPQTVDFPINAYKSVIEYYFSIGGKYYVEVDPAYKTSATGKQDWPKTVRNQVPLVQQKDGVSSFNPYDNALAENFFSILKTECIHRVKLSGYDEARLIISEYINFYNNYRIQTKTKLTPLEKRNQFVA